MGTITFKERFINFCRNKKVQITFDVFFWIFAIIVILSSFNIIFKNDLLFFIIWSIYMIYYIFIKNVIYGISKKDDDFLNNNKLLDIILANKDTWYLIIYLLLFFIFILILSLFNISFIFQTICLVILIIGSFILSLKFANKISKKFKDKLVYKTDSNC